MKTTLQFLLGYTEIVKYLLCLKATFLSEIASIEEGVRENTTVISPKNIT